MQNAPQYGLFYGVSYRLPNTARCAIMISYVSYRSTARWLSAIQLSPCVERIKMKTVITDNSLCTLPISEAAKPVHIYKYIEALGEMGVRYVELDFRTIMKMQQLPDNVKYIFRLGNPMFAELAQVFDFSYVLLTIHDLKEKFKGCGAPVIMEFPALNTLQPQLVRAAQGQIGSEISMVRLRGSFTYMTPADARRYIIAARNAVTVPIDVCPMNKAKTALDTALKFSAANVDSLTMCMGLSNNYASIEEYLFTLMAVHETLLKEFDMGALCKAAVFHHLVFGQHSTDSIAYIMSLLDRDIMQLRNADTGQRVPMRLVMKDSVALKKDFVSALDNFIENEEIPEDYAEDITMALRKFDASLYNAEQLGNISQKLLN